MDHPHVQSGIIESSNHLQQHVLELEVQLEYCIGLAADCISKFILVYPTHKTVAATRSSYAHKQALETFSES